MSDAQPTVRSAATTRRTLAACAGLWLLAGLPGAGDLARAATTIEVTTTAQEVVQAEPFGIVNGRCSLGEALGAVDGGTPRPDCPEVVDGQPEPLVIRLAPGGVYARTETLPPFNVSQFSRVELDGRGAALRGTPPLGGTVRLLDSSGLGAAATPTLAIRALTIEGARSAAPGGGLDAFRIDLELDEVTFRDNRSEGPGPGEGSGGAINFSEGRLVCRHCRFLDNRASGPGTVRLFRATASFEQALFEGNRAGAGGAIESQESTLAILRSRFVDNQAGSAGGALRLGSRDVRTLIDGCAFIANDTFATARDFGIGGAIYASGQDVLIRNSLFLDNASQRGGAVFRETPLSSRIRIESSTFTGNAAGNGGAVFVEHGVIDLQHVTLIGNRSTGRGGGIYLDGTATASVRLDHSLVLGNVREPNAAPDDCHAITPRRSGGGHSLYNACNLPAGPGDQTFTGDSGDVIDNRLADNGGATRTFAVVASGPAHDAGDREFAAPPATDQRGFPRIAEGRVDLGAHERAAREVAATVDTVLGTSFESDEPRSFDDRDAFLAQAGAADATGPLPWLGNLSPSTAPVTVGAVTIAPLPPSSLYFDFWTDALPGAKGGSPTDVDLALNGLEQLDLRLTMPARALGFDFVDPAGDGTRFNLLACASTFVPGPASCPLADIVHSMEFSANDAIGRFVGFRAAAPFVQVSIREQTNQNTNEFFGRVYTAP